MKHNITLEIKNLDGKFTISTNTEDLKKILAMLPSDLIEKSEKLSNNFPLKDALISYLMNLDNWNIRERTRYSTVTSEYSYNKSALYYHRGREEQLYLSSHKLISNHVLHQIKYFSIRPEFENILLKCYIPEYQYEIVSQTIKSCFYKKYYNESEKIIDFIKQDKYLKDIFQLEIDSEEKKDFYLPQISKLDFYQEYSSRLKLAYSENELSLYDEEKSKLSFEIHRELLKKYVENDNFNLLEFDYVDTFIDYDSLINYFIERKMLLIVDRDTRFPSTNRIIFEAKDDLTSFLEEIESNLRLFLETNGTMYYD
ncbi:hypothetical protein [Chroococcus sp. FPU101]|uniref:hypothetical protein n=1 Tax=Chroococcus sp. FPU101 TaxID=1974212 RepID=UPI001A8CE119|nr:hypothetical protein [Chroococcus sp. FPU101]GFE71256.1 hypothetical protein CFPU101_38660 [Chroococcus sp. FPU101]